MSRVFVAEETALNRKVVVKVLPPEVAAGVNADRFKREIQVAARLQHPHIVPVHSAGEMQGVPFYTMPFVEGESVRVRLGRSGAFSITEAIGVLRDVAKALAYAHEHGIVHRDIKPDNVLLSGGSATVTDFGIAKAIAAARTDPTNDHQPTLTQVGSSIGTPAYMAPEQAAGDPATDHRADIYSFGCTAFEMLAGRQPFVEKSPRHLMAAHLSDTPEDVRSLRPDIPNALASLVMRCLEKEPANRPQRAADLVSTLESVTSGGGHDTMPAMLLGGQGMLRKALVAYTVAFILVAVLAKLAITAIGLPDWVFPGALVVMALGLPVILFTAYVHHTTRIAVTQTPTFTPGGTHEERRSSGAMATLALKASPHVSWKRTWIGGIYALSAFIILIAGFMTLRALGIGPAATLFASGRMERNEKLLVADFTASDTTLGPVVTDAFRTALAQSRSVVVIEPNELREVLRRMQRPPNTRVDFGVAREIASREGIKAVVLGEVIAIGGKYAVSARLISPQTAEELGRFRVTANSENEMLPAIDKLAKDLRAKIGESLRQVQATPALERVTTPSLEALKKYVQGQRIMAEGGEFTKGAALLEEAIALDTGFAMAYRRLGAEYSNRQMNDRAMALFQKAYDHRERLSDAERYLVIGSYYFRGPRQDIAKMTSAFETLIEMQPDNYTAHNNVAIAYRWVRNWTRAEESLRRSIATGYAPAVTYNQLVWVLWTQNKRDEARRVLAEYDSVFPATGQRLFQRAQLLQNERRYDSATTVYEQLLVTRDPLQRALVLVGMAGAARVRGRLQEANRRAREALALNERNGRPEAFLTEAAWRAFESAVLRDDPQRGATILDAALTARPIDSFPEPVRPYVPLAATYAWTGRGDRSAALLRSFERAREGIVFFPDERDRRLLTGAAAFGREQYDEAIRAYQAAAQLGECEACVLPYLAASYDRAGQADSALAAYRRYVDATDWFRHQVDGLFLAPALKRLGELYEARGDATNAVRYYAQFVDLWKTADPELQPKVAEVRRRISRLSDVETPRR
jgi:tetratricopeptide (TPR) repeat protein